MTQNTPTDSEQNCPTCEHHLILCYGKSGKRYCNKPDCECPCDMGQKVEGSEIVKSSRGGLLESSPAIPSEHQPLTKEDIYCPKHNVTLKESDETARCVNNWVIKEIILKSALQGLLDEIKGSNPSFAVGWCCESDAAASDAERIRISNIIEKYLGAVLKE